MPEKHDLTAWERFAAKMTALGLDPLGPYVGEDDTRFDAVQAILAESGSPQPPLPPHWEGRRPVDYDGSLEGIDRWLDFEWRQIIAHDIFPGAGQTSLAHLNEVIRNAYRGLAYFQVLDPPKRAARASEIAVAKEQITVLRKCVQSKMKSGWRSPTTDQPKEGIIEIARWSDLGIGIGAEEYYTFTPCPENGEKVKLKDGIALPLVGDRWRNVLEYLALSHDGKTAAKADLVQKLHPINRGEISEEQAVFDEGMQEKAKKALTTLRNTMSDLGRELRGFVETEDTTPPFRSNGDNYLAAFTTRHVIRDSDGNFFFRRA